MKKLLAITLAALLILAMFGCKKQADDETDGSETTEVVTTNVYENFKYDVNEEGELEITGYTYEGVELANVVIPATIDGRAIVGIGEGAFHAHKNIASVTFPESILYIDQYAFADCDYLTEINLPKNLTTVETGAFADCSALAKVTFPASLLSIGAGAFEDCTALTNFTLPEGLLTIEEGAFWGCSALTSVTIPASIIDLGDCAFYACSSLYEVNLLGAAGTADDVILAKMNAVLAAHTGEAPKTLSEAKAILADAGLHLGNTTDRGAKFVWDVSDNKIYGALTAADATLLTSINTALEGKTFASLDKMIALMKQDGVYINDLNACVASDKFVFDAEKVAFTTIYAGKSVFENCTTNTIVSVTENTFFASYAEACGYITVLPASAPVGTKIFSNNMLSFCYPNSMAISVQKDGSITLANADATLLVRTENRNLLDDHTTWTTADFNTYAEAMGLVPLPEGYAFANQSITQSTSLNGVKFTKISYEVVTGTTVMPTVIYLVTVGNVTHELTLSQATIDAQLCAQMETSFADVR